MEEHEFVNNGALVLRQGAPGEYAYRIKSGKVGVFMREIDGTELLLSELGAGEIIGEMAVMLGCNHCASVRAHGDVVLKRIPAAEMQKSARKSDSMHAHLMQLIAVRAIRHMPLFADLSQKEKERLPQGEGPFFYPKKSCLFQENDPVDHLYILCSGHVQSFSTAARGVEITVEIYKPGDVFCKSAICLDSGLFHTSTRAIDDVYVIKLEIAKFRAVMKRHDTVTKRLLSALAQRNFMRQLEMEQRSTMTTPEILAAFLRRLCLSYGFDPSGFTLPYKKSLIAARLGMEMETLSRAWPKLKDYGILVDGAHITILDKL